MKLYLLLIALATSSLWLLAPTARKGQDRALFFAVDQYEQMPDLKNPIQNAQDLAKELETRYGFIPEVISNPTLIDIENKIKEYQKAYQQEQYDSKGQLLIFFSGHGVKYGNNGYFMPSDANPDRPHATAIEYDYWRTVIDDIPCQHILVAVDACHSITFDPNWQNRTDRKFKRPGEQDTDQILANHRQYRSRLFFTSDAQGDETPDRSTFAHQLLEGLRVDQPLSGYLSSRELFASYLQKAAPSPGGGNFGKNEAGSCFLFFQQARVNLGDARADKAAWRVAKEAHSISGYQAYLRQYPDGAFRLLAEEALSTLQAEEAELLAWENAVRSNTSQAYDAFIQEYPNSLYREVAERSKKQLELEASLPSNMVLVQGGSFEMGDTFGDGYSLEKPVHEVTISDFYMGRYEVTFEEYDVFCNAKGIPPPKDVGWGRGKRPVINIDWQDALTYCNWLSERHRYRKAYTIKGDQVTIDWSADGYRLPTEAEWEYAARGGGMKQKYAGTSEESLLSYFANFCDQNCEYTWKTTDQNDGYTHTAPVGTYKANELGLYDMSGNVWEWCWDWYEGDYYSKSPKTNPGGPGTGSDRVIRGGSYGLRSRLCRTTYRYHWIPTDHNGIIGFRLVRSFRS